MLRYFGLAAAVVVFGVITAYGQTLPSPLVQLEKLGPAPSKEEMENRSLSAESTHIAWAAARGTKAVVVVDGVAGPELDGLRGDTGTVTLPDVAFSPDGSRVAYAGVIGEKTFAIVDGKMSPPYDSEPPRGFSFSMDGKRLAYEAKIGDQYFVVVDGRAGPMYDEVSFPHFSLDGKHVAYAAKTKRQWWVVVDDRPSIAIDFIGIDRVCFSPAGDLTYVVHTPLGYVVVNADKTELLFDMIGNSPIFSQDGKHMAYVGINGTGVNEKYQVVVDGIPGPKYDSVGVTLVFSRDGQHVAYVAKIDGGAHAVIDGKAGPAFEMVDALVFSADGKRVAYVGQKGGKIQAVVDGQPSASYDGMANWVFGGIVFSPDGQHVAFPAESGNSCRVVVDGQAGPAFTYTGIPVFSPDGKHMAYVTYKKVDKIDKMSMVVDGHAEQEFDVIFEDPWTGLRLGNGGEIEFLAIRDGTLYRVHQGVTKP